MVREVLGNILRLFQHIYQGMHESLEKDVDKYGIKGLLRNPVALGLAALMILGLLTPLLFRHTPIEVAYADKEGKNRLPGNLVKSVIMMAAVETVKGPGEITIEDIRVERIYPKRMDDKNVECINYSLDMKAPKVGKKHLTGTVILERRKGVWFRYFPASGTWAPV